MKKTGTAFAITLALSAVLLVSSVGGVSAQIPGSQPITLVNPLSAANGGNCTDLTCPMQAIINFLFTIAIPLCAIMVLVGGFRMLTAGGDPKKFSEGRKTILYAVVGFAVILISGGVATLIKNTLGG